MASADNFWVMIQFFGFAIFLIIATLLWNTLTTTDMDDAIWDQSSIGQGIKEDGENVYSNIDNIGFILFIALHLGVLVLAFVLRTHPVVYIAGLLLTAILALVAAPLSNAYADIIANDALAPSASEIPKVNIIMTNLPTIEIIFAFVTMIIMFGLAKFEGFV